jgi:hypothetical protein
MLRARYTKTITAASASRPSGSGGGRCAGGGAETALATATGTRAAEGDEHLVMGNPSRATAFVSVFLAVETVQMDLSGR